MMVSCELYRRFYLVIVALPSIPDHSVALFLTMWTQGQVNVLSSRQSVELDCEFYADSFSMFRNPVTWKKHQRQEQTDINIMGNILPPFFQTNRFLVSFSNASPRYRLKLLITDLSLEDSGNYTCEIRGPKTNILGSVTHYLFIRAPVDEVYFVTKRDVSTDYHQIRPLNEVALLQGAPGALGCVSFGGYPMPEMTVLLGDEDLTHQFTLAHTLTMKGQLGLRIIYYKTERWTDQLTVSAGDDGKRLTCVSTVSDTGSINTTTKLLVTYGPIVKCFSRQASLDEKNVYIKCDVRARPALTTLYWLIDINGTTVAEGKVKEEYWTLVMARSDGVIETRLFMRRATKNSFRKYTLYAENSVAVSRTEAELTEKSAPLTIVELDSSNSRVVSYPFQPPAGYRMSSSKTSGSCIRYHILTSGIFVVTGLVNYWMALSRLLSTTGSIPQTFTSAS